MGFTRRSTAEDVLHGLDLEGKTAVVTGINSGLGYESMRVLEKHGAHVIGLARTMEKAKEACDSVYGKTTPLACELSDFASVKACAESIKALGRPIDILLTNAGIMAPARLSTAHGVEMQFATNHLGHFILINHLLPQVQAAEGGRIVILSSAAHALTVTGGIDFDNLDGARRYSPTRFYGQSKLANLLHARALARRLEGTGTTANALHPGVIQTNLGRDSGGFLMAVAGIIAKPFMKSIGQGAATQCYVATNPKASGESGQYFSDCRVAKTSAWGRDDELGEELWRISEQLTADYLS
jgi:WW domain-containing oxidoreductase